MGIHDVCVLRVSLHTLADTPTSHLVSISQAHSFYYSFRMGKSVIAVASTLCPFIRYACFSISQSQDTLFLSYHDSYVFETGNKFNHTCTLCKTTDDAASLERQLSQEMREMASECSFPDMASLKSGGGTRAGGG